MYKCIHVLFIVEILPTCIVSTLELLVNSTEKCPFLQEPVSNF